MAAFTTRHIGAIGDDRTQLLATVGFDQPVLPQRHIDRWIRFVEGDDLRKRARLDLILLQVGIDAIAHLARNDLPPVRFGHAGWTHDHHVGPGSDQRVDGSSAVEAGNDVFIGIGVIDWNKPQTHAVQRIEAMKEFFETTSRWYADLRKLPTGAVVKFVKMGGRLRKLLGVA